MTDHEFDALLDRLMDGVPEDPTLAVLWKYSAQELRMIAPLIDAMVDNAYQAGKLEGYLELLTAQKKKRVEVAAQVPF